MIPIDKIPSLNEIKRFHSPYRNYGNFHKTSTFSNAVESAAKRLDGKILELRKAVSEIRLLIKEDERVRIRINQESITVRFDTGYEPLFWCVIKFEPLR